MKMTLNYSEEISHNLPDGWKAILVKQLRRKMKDDLVFYISPEGIKFTRIEDAQMYSSGRKIKMGEKRSKEEEEKDIGESVKKRRKIRVTKDPLNDLLKKTLKKMHSQNPFKRFEIM